MIEECDQVSFEQSIDQTGVRRQVCEMVREQYRSGGLTGTRFRYRVVRGGSMTRAVVGWAAVGGAAAVRLTNNSKATSNTKIAIRPMPSCTASAGDKPGSNGTIFRVHGEAKNETLFTLPA